MLGKISDERFYRMSANCENEQNELLVAVVHDEQAVRQAEQENIDLNFFLEAIRECTDLIELTPTIVNTLIKRIDVHSIPIEKELVAAMEEIREKPLKSA